MFTFDTDKLFWINEPLQYYIESDKVTLRTEPDTDFWQRTYYGFQHDNCPALLYKTEEQFFSFSFRACFNTSALFDQCGLAIYQDSDNWVKAAIEYHDNDTQWLGSVVTNYGYSDWATTTIGASVKEIWYRLSRRVNDFLIENSFDGVHYQQMRIFHLFEGAHAIHFGLLACSPTTGSFDAVFTDFSVTECVWQPHQ